MVQTIPPLCQDNEFDPLVIIFESEVVNFLKVLSDRPIELVSPDVFVSYSFIIIMYVDNNVHHSTTSALNLSYRLSLVITSSAPGDKGTVWVIIIKFQAITDQLLVPG